MVAPTASMNPAVVTAGPEFGLDLGRPISAVGEHIIAGVALVQQPIQLLAGVHGRVGHRIMPDQLVLGVRVHMVLVAEGATAMLLAPAHRGRSAALWRASASTPQVCAQPSARRSRHHCSAASAPARYWRRAATRHVALGRKMRVEAVKQLLDSRNSHNVVASGMLIASPRKRENDSRSRT